MGDVLLSIVSFAVVLGSLTTLIGAAIGTGGKSTEAWVAEARAANAGAIGDIRTVSATVQESAGTGVVEVTLENTGSATYSAWARWDVWVHYTTTDGTVSIQRLGYADTLATGKWVVDGIYLDAVTRAEQGVEPESLNPTEQMVIRLQFSPAAKAGTSGMVVITTQDALSTRIHFDA